jgi:cation transport ATPase
MPEQRYRHEKEEKQEKDEKGRDEKEQGGMEEKWRRDPLSRVISGLIVITIGVLFLLASQEKIAWEDWWAYLLLALGGIFIFEVLLRSIMPAYRRPVYGKLIAGLVLIAIGASNIYGFVSWWPLIIIGVGVFILFSALLRPRK